MAVAQLQTFANETWRVMVELSPSLLLGWLFDFVLPAPGAAAAVEHHETFAWWELTLAGATSLALVGLLVRRLVRARRARRV